VNDHPRFSVIDQTMISVSDREKRSEGLGSWISVFCYAVDLRKKEDMAYLTLYLLHTVTELDQKYVQSETFSSD
jgi:hypothetical protein